RRHCRHRDHLGAVPPLLSWDEPAGVVLEHPHERGDVRMRTGQPVYLVGGEQHHEAPHEYGEPGEQPARVRAGYTLSPAPLGAWEGHTPLHRCCCTVPGTFRPDDFAGKMT